MKASPYTLQPRPGSLIEAARDMKKNKRAVYKAIGMPLRKKRKAGKPTDSAMVAMKPSKKAKKGSMSLVKSPTSHSHLRTKKAKKGTSGKGFGDEKLQNLSMEHREEGAKHFKGTKKRKGSMSLIKSPKSHSHLRTKKAKKVVSLA